MGLSDNMVVGDEKLYLASPQSDAYSDDFESDEEGHAQDALLGDTVQAQQAETAHAHLESEEVCQSDVGGESEEERASTSRLAHDRYDATAACLWAWWPRAIKGQQLCF